MTLSFSRTIRGLAVLIVLSGLALSTQAQPEPGKVDRWSEAQANAWYAQQPWPVGADFLPSTAINELEMWQADTYDPVTIDRELGWAEAIGMNTMRVFLHNLLWDQDPKGFQHHLDNFLAIAARHHIRPVFVLFDSCWESNPKLGPQHPPIPGVHNSGWVQAPGAAILNDPSQYPRLEGYVEGVVGASPRTRAFWPGTCGTSRTTITAKATPSPTGTRATAPRSFSSCCPRCLTGRGPRIQRSL